MSLGDTNKRSAIGATSVLGSEGERLLLRLLDTYEAGARFERANGRDVLLHLDEQDFPGAFAPDGHEILLALEAGAGAMQAAGALRVVHRRVPGAGDRVELRLGPVEVPAAYVLARAIGYLPLRDALDRLTTHIRALAARGARAPDWWQTFLGNVASQAAAGDLTPLRVDDRARLKSEWLELRDALTAADALSRTVDAWERHLSEALFADSKRLGRIRTRVAQLLRAADPRWLGVAPGEATDSMNVITSYGIRRRPPTITVAGSISIPLAPRRQYRLDDFEPVAILPAAWASAVAAGVSAAGVQVVTTIENEYPFLAYVEECGGAAGLGARQELVVYVGGFPSEATLSLLSEVVERHPTVIMRHWGDADAGGLAIWWLLRSRLCCPVELFRTTSAWVRETATRQGQRLSTGDRAALRAHVERFEAVIAASGTTDDVREALELARCLLDLDMKLEQERI